ncbi:hypothetical protein LCGC14_1347180 [marine sediment metagenome]|uniref:Uncharacterized protein n=1 Tax=marine sediment metagenome TaxID=412755 RepID=A0A0F9KY08_9ZZZZ
MSVYERVPFITTPQITTSGTTTTLDVVNGERQVPLSKDEIGQRLKGWMMASLPCVVCGRTLQNVFEGSVNQPSGGLAFTSGGHYGSTVYDPFNDESLELNICDECLTKASSTLRILRYKRIPQSELETTHESRFWDAARD